MNDRTYPIWPVIENNNFSVLHYASDLNPWIDFLIFVKPEDLEKAIVSVQTAMDDYWNEKFNTYGDALHYHMDVPYFIIYHDSEDTSESYEDIWWQMINDIENTTDIKEIN